MKLAYSYPENAYGHDLLKVGRSVIGFLLYSQASFPRSAPTVCSCQQPDICSVLTHSVFHLFLFFYNHGHVPTLNTSNFKNLFRSVNFLLLANFVGEAIGFFCSGSLLELPWRYPSDVLFSWLSTFHRSLRNVTAWRQFYVSWLWLFAFLHFSSLPEIRYRRVALPTFGSAIFRLR